MLDIAMPDCASFAFPGGAVDMAAHCARHVQRCRPAVVAAASAALGLSLPRDACLAATAGERHALWLGPDEWLLLAPEADDALVPALEDALAGQAYSRVDVSDRQIAFEIRGRNAAALLAIGCPLDLDESRFPVGMCTRTVMGKAEIILWRRASDVFHMEVWRSFAAYVHGLLAQGAQELDE